MGPQELENVKAEVKLIQNNVRGWLLRKNYVNLREATKTLQVAWRERKKQFEKDCMDEGDEHINAAREKGRDANNFESLDNDAAFGAARFGFLLRGFGMRINASWLF